MKNIIEALKKHLSENKDSYLSVDEWAGNTEVGFYTAVEFDFEAMLSEIDKFSQTFKE